MIVEQHRTLRILRAAAELDRLQAADMAALRRLEATYARSVAAYEVFDHSFDYAWARTPRGWATGCDVDRELARVSQTEINYTFAQYFDAAQYDYYADVMHVHLPPDDQMIAYAEHDDYDYGDDAFDMDWPDDDLGALENEYDLDPPDYYDDFVADEPDPSAGEAFDQSDDRVQELYRTEPDDLGSEYGEYFDHGSDDSAEPQDDGPSADPGDDTYEPDNAPEPDEPDDQGDDQGGDET
jgi:hypothetical protein